ncbi:MATE family efflux transporter [Phenylobacterium sp.]|jgi:MATE family multidrug resistance protein|uniref:MATE family efflux transporter n=1 Tax=Phenylobacterium sp. TaxID=1871053 RepID=UPI002E35220F|nr:MATE family efflux transporter [Phenylobacterium sp.]HEX2558741.1 MATE family efflux transporter [Phenylobacterium sp.]
MATPAPATSETEDRPDIVRTETAELLKLSGPVVMSRLGIMTMGLTDAIVLGRHSAEQLAFHILAWAPTSVVLTLGIGLLMGVQVMTARAIGEGRRHESGAVLRRGLVYGFWLSLAALAALAILGPIGLRNIGLEPGLGEGASGPVIVFALSMPAMVLSTACAFWLEAQSRATPSMLMMWGANAVNLALLLLLVPGNFGLPQLGAVGAAWATFGARLFLLLGLVAYIARMKEARAWGVFDRPRRDLEEETMQRRVGYGAGASNFFEVAAFASLNVVAGWVGGLAVASWGVVLNVAALIFMVPLGLGTATSVLVGRAYGARDRHGVVRSALIGFAVTTAFGVLVSLIVWPSARLIAAGYTSDARVVAIVAPALVLSCLFFLADALQVVVAQALRARGDVLLPTLTHMTSYVLVMMPLAWWLALPMGLGVQGLVWAVIVASLLSAALLLGRFWMLARRPI